MADNFESSRKFLATAFWTLGFFCLYWESQVFIAAVRFTDVDLPIFGKCTQMESIIFTLSSVWLPLGMLHMVLHAYQRLSHLNEDPRPHFPGAIGERTVPFQLRVIRIAMFVALLIVPTLFYLFMTGRAFSHFKVVPTGNIEFNLAEKKALDPTRLIFYPRESLQNFPKNSALWWVNAERTEAREVVKSPKRLPELKKDTGSAPTAPAPSEVGEPYSLGYERVKVTALPLQPLLFSVYCIALAWSVFVIIWNGFAHRRRSFFLRKVETIPASGPTS